MRRDFPKQSMAVSLCSEILSSRQSMPVGCAWGWCWKAEHAQAYACTMTAPHQHDIMVLHGLSDSC